MERQSPNRQPAEARPVAYEPQGLPVTRRAFRVLLFLTFVNTVLLGGFVLGPGLSTFAREQWAAYQQRKAEAADAAKKAAAAALAKQKRAADLQFARAHRDPPDKLVYADDADGVAIVNAKGDAVVARRDPNYRPSFKIPWPMPHIAPSPAYARRFDVAQNVPSGVIFLHERQTPDGTAVLVAVDVAPSVSYPKRQTGYDGTSHAINLERSFGVSRTPLDGDGSDAGGTRRFTYACNSLGRHTTTIIDGRGEPPIIQARGQLRLYAGQPHPTDATRFFIPYELDGQTGRIEGGVREHDVILRAEGPLEKYWVPPGVARGDYDADPPEPPPRPPASRPKAGR